MKEEFLHYIWANSLYRSHMFISTSGKRIEVLNPGQSNRDAGPDFFNARIREEGAEVAGNIEIHLRNSDWNRHGHQNDPAYDNVILSVVRTADVPVYTSQGREVETVVVDYADRLYDEYLYMQENRCQPGCAHALVGVDPSWFQITLQSIAVERLDRKCRDLGNVLEQTRNDWQECFYRQLCRYWAGNVNSEPFYRLALALPYKTLLRHADRTEVLEALLLGCSGLLGKEEGDDGYIGGLRKEFRYLKAKYELEELPVPVWKFMRIRPDAFPTVRLALLAAFLTGSENLTGAVLDAGSLKEVFRLFEVTASSYWNDHYRPGIISPPHPKHMGNGLKNIIVINAVIPFVFLYGRTQGKEEYCDKALTWLEELEPEQNYITASWEACGYTFDSALQTQALIQLRKEYCDCHRCLQCRIGQKVLRLSCAEGAGGQSIS